MAEGSYHHFCPVAMASEVLGARCTINLVRELVAGSTRFNDLRRGLPRMSPALLSKRLKELERRGIVRRVPSPREPDVLEYRLTPAGEELGPIIDALGVWGHRWIESELQLENLDAALLMWDIRRNFKVDKLPPRRLVAQFIYAEQPEKWRNWWIVVDPREGPDLCLVAPGYDVDLYVRTDLRTMTAVWMGLETLARAVDEERVLLVGDQRLRGSIAASIDRNFFASVQKRVG
ncbi:MAG: helix-turn-helix domain-containing protein [Acetobacterales bacterium]